MLSQPPDDHVPHRKSAAVPTNLDELAGSLDPAR
jgi:hypothetical protein